MREMKKKLLVTAFSFALCMLCLAGCDENDTSSVADDTAYVYCSSQYNAGFGNYGYFAVAPMDDCEPETDFKDLSAFTLGGAFTGMKVDNAAYDEENGCVVFSISGALAEGEYGTIEGSGIVKNKSVKAEIPITQAQAYSESVVYGGTEKQQIEINLESACFNKDISASDFTLSGAAQNMTVESVETDFVTDDDGDEVLSQTATLTLSGSTDGSDYAYIEISGKATTFNKPLTVTLTTDFYGVYVTNDHVDTFTLSDIVYVQAKNITFVNDIKAEDISLDGCLKDYAVINAVDYVNETLIALHLSFPYTYIENDNSIGYINFSAKTNTTNAEYSCSTVVAAPAIHSSIEVKDHTVSMELTLEHEEFNLLDFYPFSVYASDGSEVLVSGIDIVDLDEYLSITFVMPDNSEGVFRFELKDAYDVVKADGSKENITIVTYFS